MERPQGDPHTEVNLRPYGELWVNQGETNYTLTVLRGGVNVDLDYYVRPVLSP